MRSGRTQIISNERGHIKSDIPRSLASPWGSFVGTWQAERNPIQLKTRTKLMTHLSQSVGSKHSSRAASARVSRESQRETVTSPRPQSAQVSHQEETKESHPVSPESVGTPQSTQPPSTADAGSKPSTPASEVDSQCRTDTAASAHSSLPPHSKTPSPVPSAQETSHTSPSNGQPHVARAASATSTRSGVSRMPASSVPSRTQSATTTHTTPPQQPNSANSQVGSEVPSHGRVGTQSPLPSTQVSTPHNPVAPATVSETSSRAQTALSVLQDHSHQNQ